MCDRRRCVAPFLHIDAMRVLEIHSHVLLLHVLLSSLLNSPPIAFDAVERLGEVYSLQRFRASVFIFYVFNGALLHAFCSSRAICDWIWAGLLKLENFLLLLLMIAHTVVICTYLLVYQKAEILPSLSW